MPSNAPTNLYHWMDIDWIKEQSTLSDGLGIPLLNRFVALLNAPSDRDSRFRRNGWLELQVLSCDVPNISIDPVELDLNGVRRFYFKGRSDRELSITFLETPSLLLRSFFYNWMELAVKIEEGGGGVTRHYMEEYMPTPSEFLIFPLAFNGDGWRCDRFWNVFPYDISGISYNYAQAGEIIKTTVQFKYMTHTVRMIDNRQNYHVSEKGYKPDMTKEWLNKASPNFK